MADDILTRLRHMAWTAPEGEPWADALRDAADQIERLRAEVARLGSFLHPVGMVIDTYGTSLTKRASNEN